MERNIISGRLCPVEDRKQRQLHQQLADFHFWMQRPKDAGEIARDKRRSVPRSMLPTVF